MADVTINIGPEDAARLLTKVQEQNVELAALRRIATDYLAESYLIVKPEDAADAAKWAANAQHVRELLKHMPEDIAEGIPTCIGCGAFRYTAHEQRCVITAAWRALGDPRGQADIERAHEAALREHQRRFPRTVRHLTQRLFGSVGIELDDQLRVVGSAAQQAAAGAAGAFRLASESEQAARERFPYASIAGSGVPVRLDERLGAEECQLDHAGRPEASARMGARMWLRFHRFVSDARGMEAVEAEARRVNELIDTSLTDDEALAMVEAHPLP